MEQGINGARGRADGEETARAVALLRRTAGATPSEEAVEAVVAALAARGAISIWDAATAIRGAIPAMCGLCQTPPGAPSPSSDAWIAPEASDGSAAARPGE